MSKKITVPSFLQPEIAQVGELFHKELYSSSKLLTLITRYIIKTKGKQLRPMLVFSAAGMVGEIQKSTYSAAYLIELMHTATLVHDDVVDDAEKRRGFFSINALWKNKIAVLVGDYFLSKGLLYAIENNEIEILRIISHAVKQMSEGELLQLEKARNLSSTEEIYYEIIRKKTAALFVAAMQAGAVSTGACSSEKYNTLTEIAELLGIAFQIKDDILDFSTQALTGKAAWNDLKEKKMTLPLLYTLQQLPEPQAKQLRKALNSHKNKYENLKRIADTITKTGGLEYSTQKLTELCNRAEALCTTFPANQYNATLKELIKFVKQ
ncbi:MAG: polyprenyl synthetase family protein [Bacteroidales bacterium]|jgi:octaprenyl-diphosphate synthase|nr:polyprenyl synthetase family protein [Bacteroidales bacterium]